MKARIDQLDSNLNGNLSPIYIISGDVPLLVEESIDKIRTVAKSKGFDERKTYTVDRSFDWNLLLDEANALSLFSAQKLIELRLDKAKPGTAGSKAILAYCENLPEDTILVLILPKLDSATLKSKWLSTLEKLGLLVQIWPVERHQMPSWVSNRARAHGLTLDQDAAEMLAEKVEGNLLAAQQELEKLKLLCEDQKITAETLEEAVADSAKFDIFSLTDACLAQNATLAVRIINNLRAEGSEPTILLWALTKDIRILNDLVKVNSTGGNHQGVFSKHRVIKKRQQGLSKLASKHNHNSVTELIRLAKTADDIIKGIEPHRHIWSEINNIALKTIKL